MTLDAGPDPFPVDDADPFPGPGVNPSPTSTAATPTVDPLDAVRADLAARLEAMTPAVDVDRFELRDHPRVVDGLVVPALSVATFCADVHGGKGPPAARLVDYGFLKGQRVPARPEYVLAGQLGAVHTAALAVGSYLRGGQWFLAWVGPVEARHDALGAFLGSLADWARR